MKQITFEQYRNIDLTILVALTVVFEAITTLATAKWFYAQPIAISISLTLICVAMMRWSGYAAVVAVTGGLVFSITSGATIEQYLIYCVGNLFALVALLVIKLWGKEKIRCSRPRLMLYVLVAYIGMALGRWLVSLLFGGDLMAFVVFITTDIITLLFAEIIILILHKVDGMIEDQKAYLFRLEREKQEEANMDEAGEDY